MALSPTHFKLVLDYDSNCNILNNTFNFNVYHGSSLKKVSFDYFLKFFEIIINYLFS